MEQVKMAWWKIGKNGTFNVIYLGLKALQIHAYNSQK